MEHFPTLKNTDSSIFQKDRPFTTEFYDIEKIKKLEDFSQFAVMNFLPRKEDISRILSLAKQMHQKRTEQGAANSSDPLKIIDIGGANGALGKLVTDLSKENGIDIEYTVVDPDLSVVQQAAKFYENNKSLHFKNQTAESFLQEQYINDKEISRLIQERSELTKQGNQLQKDFLAILEELAYAKHDDVDFNHAANLLKERYPSSDITASNLINAWLASDQNQNSPDRTPEAKLLRLRMCIYTPYFKNDSTINRIRKNIRSITLAIENLIGQQSPTYDVIINSWMPPKVDLTTEIRELNGAAIFYALERSGQGVTGCLSTNFCEGASVDSDTSYRAECNYTSQYGWLCHSTAQLNSLTYQNDSTLQLLKEDPDRINPFRQLMVPSHSNGFIIQTKHNYDLNKDSLLSDSVIHIGKPYPWEDELQIQGGAVSKVIKINDDPDSGLVDFVKPFQSLAEKLLQDAKK